MLLKGIAREKKTRIKQAAALTLATFKRTIKSIDVSTATGLRNRALLLLVFTGAFRRSELEALNIEQLTFDEEGLIVTLGHSKTNHYLGSGYTAHSLRASFVTVSKLNGADDTEVMNQTKHKTSAMIRRYTRLDNVRQHNSAKELGL